MIKISRWYNKDCTLGRLSCGDFHCFTLELPDLGNEPDISCIPPGTYEAFKRRSPKNGLCIELIGVEDRTHIQIHAGNYLRQILGCILVGDAIKYLDGDSVPDVTNSQITLNNLLALLPRRFKVEIN